MKIVKALKLKKSLAEKIIQLREDIEKNNCVLQKEVALNPEHAEVSQMYEEWLKAEKMLVVLKNLIQISNAPVFAKIYRISELKSRLMFFKNLFTNPVKASNIYQKESESLEDRVNSLVINEKKRKEEISLIIKEINEIQDQLNEFNYTNDLVNTYDLYNFIEKTNQTFTVNVDLFESDIESFL